LTPFDDEDDNDPIKERMEIRLADPEVPKPVLGATVPATPAEIATPEPLGESTLLMPRRKMNPFQTMTS
jgi:hypothetical protein